MRPWRVRLAMRRSRIQWAFIAVVLISAIVSATLLSTLYLLSQATETFAARAALTRATAEDIGIPLEIGPNGTVEQTLKGADATAAEILGDTPYARTVAAESTYLKVPRGESPFALAYLASTDELEEFVKVRIGHAPEPSNGGPVQLLVPSVFLYDMGLAVGDRLTLAPYNDSDAIVEYELVGAYGVKDPHDPAWALDRLDGATHNPSVIVPRTRGPDRTDGYGPFYTAHEDVEAAPVEAVRVVYVPDFSDTSLEKIGGIVTRSVDLELAATRNLGDAADTIRAVSNIGQTLGGVTGSLAVTRSSVLVTGLLLLVLAIAALSQSARLMAERRYGELHLMIARGGARKQLFRLGFIEAVALGAVTAAVAAPLARLAYLALAEVPAMEQAGMAIDPGIPPLTWAVAGVVGIVLIALLVAPLLRRQGSFIEAEQSRSRPNKLAAFQRSGLDIAVLALAALAYWQLKNYRSPVLTSDSVAAVDPLLAAGPALALTAGALISVRLIPPAAKVLEGVAARGRGAVLPLGAWEVGRRSARAVSAVLLLTIAVSIGTFAATFLTTWQQSQEDQAAYQHPPDVIVSDIEAPWLGQRTLVAGDGSAESVSPAVEELARIGRAPQDGLRVFFKGNPVELVASDTAGLKTFGEDRLNEVGGARIAATLGGDTPAETNPIEIPGKHEQIAMDVTATSSQDLGALEVVLRGVIRNAHGDYQTISFGNIAVDGASHHVTGAIALREELDAFSTPLYLVGVQAMWVSRNAADAEVTFDATRIFSLDVSISEVAAQTPAATVGGDIESEPLVIPADLGWTVTNHDVGVDSLEPDGDQIHIRVTSSPRTLLDAPVKLVLTAAERAWPVPLVATSAALQNSSLEVGDDAAIVVDNTLMPAYVAEQVPMLPGESRGNDAIVANNDQLQVALVQAMGDVVPPREWWATIDDVNLDGFVSSLSDDLTVTTQAGLAYDLQMHPLRIAIQAALWLVAGAAVVLAALGFAVHAVVTVRGRETELAQQRAIGVQRGQLLRIVTLENALLSSLGLVFGVGIGIALSYLVAPLASVGPEGRPPIPPVIVEVPWDAVGLLAGEVAIVLVVSVIIAAAMLRRINPAAMLRRSGE